MKNSVNPDQLASEKPADLDLHCFQIGILSEGAQWLSGRVLDSRPRCHGFEPHRRHCIVSLSKNINPSLELVQPKKTHPCLTERLFWDVKNQIKQTMFFVLKTSPAAYIQVYFRLDFFTEANYINPV